MPDKTAKSFHFWRELKQRNILRVMTVYVAAAFGFLELVDIISGPLQLPGWIISAVMIAAVIGFPVVFMISWIMPGSSAEKSSAILPDGKEPDLYEPVGVQALGDLMAGQAAQPAELENVKSEKGRIQVLSVSSFMVIAAAVVLFLFYSGKSVPFQQRGWILITDFENNTGEEIFDHSLNAAFALSINQSRHINVIPRHRMFETLKRMKMETNAFIDEETGREIALREGVKVCIIPSISRVGSQYILTVRIQDARTGNIFRSEVLYTKNQDEILRQLDKLTKKIRRNLGESRYKISGQNKPLYEVTTSSLDALKQFSLGLENHLNMEFGTAVIHYKNAIGIDSGFTAAKASLGNLLYERFDQEKGREWLDEAMESIDDLTDNEKYSILAFYAVNIEKDLEKGIDFTRTIIELYPDDPTTYNNLGWYYQNQGKYEEATKAYKKALRIDPNLMIAAGGLIWIYLDYLGEIDSALVWSEKIIQAGPENPWGYYYLGSVHVARDKLEQAVTAYSRAWELDPNFLMNQYRLAHTFRLLDRFDESIEILMEILQNYPQDAAAHYYLGWNYHLKGDSDQARIHFLEYKKWVENLMRENPNDPWTYIANGLVLTHLGEAEAGWELGKKATELDASIHFELAELLAAQDRKSEALEQLEKALQTGYRNLTWLKLNADIDLLSGEDAYRKLIREHFH
jgi:tetratricopeptide (TPR) repeat protein